MDTNPALVVGRDRHERRLADPEEPKRAGDGRMHLLPAHDANRRRAGEPLAVHVPADAVEDVEARGGERRDVGHLAAGDEAERHVRREPEELGEPTAGHLLDDGGGRAAHVQARVLVPRRREPVGGERRGNGPADHEAEVAAARDRHEPGVRRLRELPHDLGGIDRSFRQRASERGAKLVHRHIRKDRTAVERAEEVARDRGGQAEEVARAVRAVHSSYGDRVYRTTPRRASSAISFAE